jgi:hypothetical protein
MEGRRVRISMVVFEIRVFAFGGSLCSLSSSRIAERLAPGRRRT